MGNKKDIKMESLIEKLKSKDIEYKKALKFLQILFFILLIIYAGLFIVNPDPDLTINHRIAGGLYVAAFAIFAIYFRRNYKRYKTINYFDPVKKVLESTVERYSFWHKETWWTSIGFICLDVASIFVAQRYFPEGWSLLKNIIVVQLIFAISAGVGFILGLSKWKKENRPIRDAARTLLKELEE